MSKCCSLGKTTSNGKTLSKSKAVLSTFCFKNFTYALGQVVTDVYQPRVNTFVAREVRAARGGSSAGQHAGSAGSPTPRKKQTLRALTGSKGALTKRADWSTREGRSPDVSSTNGRPGRGGLASRGRLEKRLRGGFGRPVSDGAVGTCRAGRERRRTRRIFFTEPCLGEKHTPTPLPGSLLLGEARQCPRLRKGGRRRSLIEAVAGAVGAAEVAAAGTPRAPRSLRLPAPKKRRCALG